MSNNTPNLGIAHIATNQSQKEATANTAFDNFDLAMTDHVSIDVGGSADVTPTAALITLGFSFILTGAITAAIALIVPAKKKFFRFNHNAVHPSIGDYPITVKVAGQTGVKLQPGEKKLLYCDGVDVVDCNTASFSFETLSRDARTTTSEAVADNDRTKVVTFNNASSVSATIGQAGTGGNFADGWWCYLFNIGAGTVTLTPSTSTINGASTATLTQYAGGLCFTDGTNYFFMTGSGGGGGATTLAGLTDVAISSPTNGQLLTYDTGTSKWKNQDAVGGGVGSLAGYRRTNRMVCKQKATGGSLTQIGDVINVLGTEFSAWEYPDTTRGQSTSYDNGAADTVAGWQGNTSLNYILGTNLDMWAEAYLGDVTDIIFMVGLFSNSSLGGTTLTSLYNDAYIRFDVTASDAFFTCITDDGFGGRTTTVTAVAPAALTSYRFRIVCNDSAPNVKFYINDVLVATHTTHLPGTTQRVIWQVSGAWHTAPGSPTIGISEVAVQSDR